jgi:hypothetical protein
MSYEAVRDFHGGFSFTLYYAWVLSSSHNNFLTGWLKLKEWRELTIEDFAKYLSKNY